MSDSFTFFAYVDVSQGKVAHTRFALFYFLFILCFVTRCHSSRRSAHDQSETISCFVDGVVVVGKEEKGRAM